MVVGSSGQCVEVCGDGKNFGLYDCDDGNTNNGDGCSSVCLIEDGFSCSGGSKTTADTCSVQPPYISSVVVTPKNNLIIIFTQPIFITE